MKRDRLHIVNAIFYLTKTGCQWRFLPKDFPPPSTVYDYFKKWNMDGIWKSVLDLLNEKNRIIKGRNPDLSYGIIDSQSVKTQYNSDDRGIDGGKKVKGRKRHMVTDKQGHMLHIKVHAANIHDTVGGCDVMDRTTDKFPSLKGLSADEGYRKTLENYVIQTLGLKMEISKKIKDGWAVLAKRWVVERTFAWINNYRRLSKDFEILTGTAENLIRISMIQIMLDKLT